MAYCCTVYQSIAVKNQGRASCTCLRRRRIRRQQLNRLFSAGCSTRDRKVKNSILWCTAVGNSCFRSRLPRCYRSNTDGCCGTCPASGTCHTRGAGWASRPSNAGRSGRTPGTRRAGRTCRAGDAGCSGCTAGTRGTYWAGDTGCSGCTAGTRRGDDKRKVAINPQTMGNYKKIKSITLRMEPSGTTWAAFLRGQAGKEEIY